MRRSALPFLSLTTCLLAASAVHAQERKDESATVQVTATRFPEDPAKVPASLTVITAQELEDRGATDLRSALAMAAGVQIAPGGDGGPASAVPAFYGLKEIDAFLLVVDGTPWGGAFNPFVATLDLHDVERIEVQRGAAPVMYGATSFVGVIHVIHKLPADAKGSASLSLGSYQSGSAAVTLKLPGGPGRESSLSADMGRQGFTDDRTSFKRAHVVWRNRMDLGGGSFRYDVDAAALEQQPGSPHPRAGKVLDPSVPVDANHNPDGAYLNTRQGALRLGYDHAAGAALWSTALSFTGTRQDNFRGFLNPDAPAPDNATGFRQRIRQTDVYLDSHLAWSKDPKVKVVLGVDLLHGSGSGRGGDFDYLVAVDGSSAPGSGALPALADARIEDQRDFAGLYAFMEWNPQDRLVIEGGLRLNQTRETRDVYANEFGDGVSDPPSTTETNSRLSGSLGFAWTFWQEAKDRVSFFANARRTFKPAAVDFGLDSEPDILKPETAMSYDLGVKGTFLDGRVATEFSLFRMDMENMVVNNSVGGVPGLKNSGKQRFQGAELSATVKVAGDVSVHLAASNHDARFTDSIQDFGGTPTQLRGHRLEMSPNQMGSLGLVYSPARGFLATLEGNYVGSVWLNKRNTAPAAGFTTLRSSLGWRAKDWEMRLTGENLTDKRSPIAESELGDAQYYLMPGRRVDLSFRFHF